MGHIQLSREADLVVVAPATADLLAKMAAGIADDLATTLLLATDKPVLAAPAMNVRMWLHAATRRNIATLRGEGVTVMEPDEGEMACGEYGPGRLPEAAAIKDAIDAALANAPSARSADRPARFCARETTARCSGAGFWSPRGRRTNRSTRCATSPTARAGSRALRSPPPPPKPAPRCC